MDKKWFVLAGGAGVAATMLILSQQTDQPVPDQEQERTQEVNERSTERVEDAPAPTHVLSEDALHQWAFNEARGIAAKDVGLDQLDDVTAAKPSGLEWKSGIDHGALLFDGYSNWMERPPENVQVPEGSFSIEAWVAPRAYEWGDEGKTSAIINQHDREQQKGFIVGMGRHGYVTFQLALNGEWHELWSPAGKVLPKDQWSHIVAQFDQKAGRVQILINGKVVAEKEVSADMQLTPAENIPLQVGKHNQATAVSEVFQANMFNGLMDNVSIYGRAFSEEEILQQVNEVKNQYNGELPAPETSYDRTVYRGDRYRPNYHFTAPQHWMNEPHAPIYYNGEYHLFYQFNPAGPFWHQIHWGHATSEDMIHWEDRPVALSPTEGTVARDGVWSGSAAYDENGVPALFYTAGHDEMIPNQMTGIARPGNPDHAKLDEWNMNADAVTVQEENLTTPEGKVLFGQFRDPYVWKEGDKWFQLVGSGVEEAGGTALLYSSTDMENWNYEKPFLIGDSMEFPKTGDVWELPFLVPIKNTKTGEEKHVFMISPYYMESSPYAARFTFYWIGSWDAETMTFTPDHQEPREFDYGEHFTGAQGFVDHEGRSLVTSILQDRRSEQDKYESGWAHGAGMPIELFLNEKQDLGISPIEEVASLRQKELVSIENATMKEANEALQHVQSDQLEIELELDVSDTKHAGLKVLVSPGNEEETFLFYNNEDGSFNIDRGRSSHNPDIEKGVQGGPVELNGDTLSLRVFVDKSIIEAYANNEKSISSRVFPELEESKGIEIYGIEGAPKVNKLSVWQMEEAIPEERD
ncbi:GH32 C-terminal domain-containing protein [Jeotgalibacillus haloalkalitolerans]|uniref:beta-fructofuranosidase n=1 Tax=Jeotgalibacillus haloalkalitolerans TaxID=3104292 RepID=A0ABU5KNI2_9BACL|nr:GH32 C-terminal domain-containing protein [Jeotgalibacillus sp. HH7-29]MDZ5712819.1 GH32 C-terminal domain-containing protein [Jeotgalibacillus sp. HH7-29]